MIKNTKEEKTAYKQVVGKFIINYWSLILYGKIHEKTNITKGLDNTQALQWHSSVRFGPKNIMGHIRSLFGLAVITDKLQL